MPEISESKNLFPPLNNDDVFKTSYGVGHHWRPGFYFPDSHTSAKITSDGIGCGIRKPDAVKPSDHFQTTTGSVHDVKIPSENLRSDRFPQAPNHWKLNYLNDFRARYLKRGISRPLSPSHQLSETHDAYKSIEGPIDVYRTFGMQPFNLKDHHNDGPSKELIPSTRNEDLAGQILYPKDKEVLRWLDPYLSTTMKDHRVWTPDELEGARKDIATYWDLEEYPKAKGFGLHDNPIPKDKVPREIPMRDKMIFREATNHTRVRPVTHHVPHTGLKSSYQADFDQPLSILQRMDRVCPVETPFVLPEPSKSSVFATPLMYETEYSTLGKCERNLL